MNVDLTPERTPDSMTEARTFLRQPGPTYETYPAWRFRCLSFGQYAINTAMEILREGSKDGILEVVASYALKEFGFRVYGNEKYGTDEFLYVILLSGESKAMEIKPRVIPDDVLAAVSEQIYKENAARIKSESEI